MSTRLWRFAAILIAGAFSSGTAAETISNRDVVGSWTTRIPVSSGETSTLEISPTLHATFRRSFSDGHKPQDFESAGEMHTTDDVYIFNMKSDGQLRCKLVLSGWTQPNGTKALFGTLYLLNADGVFNGLPISLFPSTR